MRKPTQYTRGLAREICQRLARGESWTRICAEEKLPEFSTVCAWRVRHPEFDREVEDAREMAADHFAERALEVAEASTRETAAADRLKVTTLLKRAALATSGRGRKAEAKAKKAQPQEVVFRVRHFERVTDADGRVSVREVVPEGEA
ncbi:MAG: hypothetical protein ACOY5Y_12785 [Pseudomonadota bacterium]